jgi:anhydro-N-acetylmuramic acid kinase
MSGTSLDGVDLCLVDFALENEQLKFEIVAAETHAYSRQWKEKLDNADQLSAIELAILDRSYGTYLGEISRQYLNKWNSQADLIASHGHTFFHQPSKGFTLQIGHGANLAVRSQLPVVCDFRSADVALGGQGAPLVPFGDLHLFKEHQACLNLGGIANISVKTSDQIFAYDVAPANMVLNYLCKKHFSLEYDRNGELSRSGNFNQDLYNKLESWSYYQKAAPKSLGKEDIFEKVIPLIENTEISPKDKLNTFSQHLVNRLSNDLKDIKREVLVTGGGAHNKFLMELLEEKQAIKIPSKEIVDFKEALIFALLGLHRWHNKVNILSTVTGASRDHSAGAMYLP